MGVTPGSANPFPLAHYSKVAGRHKRDPGGSWFFTGFGSSTWGGAQRDTNRIELLLTGIREIEPKSRVVLATLMALNRGTHRARRSCRRER